VKTGRVQPIAFSKTKYPNIRRHYPKAVAKGWPRILVINRPGADARRQRLLEDVPTRTGYDRDEYPPPRSAQSSQARPGSRVVTSCRSQLLPSGSLNVA
jgi:hypothetical protein